MTAQAAVTVVGGGPVGLTLALRLADLGIDVRVLEARPRLSGEGSKALCMQRETLEYWARLGIGDEVARRGVAWTLGRTYYGGTELFRTTFPQVGRSHFPPFVNVSQTEVEQLLVERCEASPRVRLGWGSEVVGLTQSPTDVTLSVRTPTGTEQVCSDFAVAADGARSPIRGLLGIDFPGHTHSDRFLIADVRAALPFPDERRFYFDPPWNRGRAVLVHPQPGSVWRIDWQVPADTDMDQERTSGRLDSRIRRIVGAADYELVWATVYRFHQRVADHFRSERVFLAGDSAHLMSPFGARGLNSGVGDAENLAWRLACVLQRQAPSTLLDSYEVERRAAALENLAVTDATMRFLVPTSRLGRMRRNAVLRLSRWVPAMRRYVDSGRLAQPHRYVASAVVEPGCGQIAPDGPLTVLAGPPGVSRLRELVRNDVLGLLLLPEWPAQGLPPTATPLVVVLPAGSSVPPDVTAGLTVVSDDELTVVSDDKLTVVSDDDGVLAAAYCPDGHLSPGGRLVVVRPDGHIAAQRDLHTPDEVSELDACALAARGGGVPAGVGQAPGPRPDQDQA